MVFVAQMTALALVAVVVTAGATGWMHLRLARVSETALSGLRIRAFRHIHDLSMLHQASENRGVLVSRVTSDVDQISRFVQWGGIGAGRADTMSVEFGSIVVTDGISMGSEGMRCSLMSRELVADSVELVTRGHCLDGVVVLVGCDKTIPAGAMALARMNVPGLVVYGVQAGESLVPGITDRLCRH